MRSQPVSWAISCTSVAAAAPHQSPRNPHLTAFPSAATQRPDRHGTLGKFTPRTHPRHPQTRSIATVRTNARYPTSTAVPFVRRTASWPTATGHCKPRCKPVDAPRTRPPTSSTTPSAVPNCSKSTRLRKPRRSALGVARAKNTACRRTHGSAKDKETSFV